MRTTILSTTRGLVVALALGLSMFALSGCVAYEPYPATPVYGTPYYAAPAPSYYYQPCCASYYSFSYSHRDRGYRNYGHHGWHHGDRRRGDWR
jgi:hypothetical protein